LIGIDNQLAERAHIKFQGQQPGDQVRKQVVDQVYCEGNRRFQKVFGKGYFEEGVLLYGLIPVLDEIFCDNIGDTFAVVLACFVVEPECTGGYLKRAGNTSGNGCEVKHV